MRPSLRRRIRLRFYARQGRADLQRATVCVPVGLDVPRQAEPSRAEPNTPSHTRQRANQLPLAACALASSVFDSGESSSSVLPRVSGTYASTTIAPMIGPIENNEAALPSPPIGAERSPAIRGARVHPSWPNTCTVRLKPVARATVGNSSAVRVAVAVREPW